MAHEVYAAVFSAVQAVASRLPNREASHLERLFALECAARGGTALAHVVEHLRDAQHAAEWWLSETWEYDVPHVAVLGQLLSTRDALGEDLPSQWRSRLYEAVDQLGERNARYGLGGDPMLLAAVLRGLASVGLTPPPWLIQATKDRAEKVSDAVGAADLAEAVARMDGTQGIARIAAAALANPSTDGDLDAPFARWWLVTRTDSTGTACLLDPQAVADARLQALAAPIPTSPRAAAMLLEAAGRSVGQLTITTAAEISDVRARLTRADLVKLVSYRSLLSTFLIIACIWNVGSLANWAADLTNVAPPSLLRQVFVGVLVFALGAALLHGLVNGLLHAYNKPKPNWLGLAETALSVAAGIIATAVS
jgi:hypothetical protein